MGRSNRSHKSRLKCRNGFDARDFVEFDHVVERCQETGFSFFLLSSCATTFVVRVSTSFFFLEFQSGAPKEEKPFFFIFSLALFFWMNRTKL